jgi:hypothetical protein
MCDGGHEARAVRRGAAALGLAMGLALGAGPAWALSEADRGAEWLQAPSPQKVRLANILSREIGGNPEALHRCLDEIFTPGSPNLSLSIREAAQQCKAKQ